MNLIYQQLSEFDTAELSDALDACGIEGTLLGIKPIISGLKLVGSAFTVKYLPYNEKFSSEYKNAGNYIDDVPSNSVVVIDNAGKLDCTTWGDILTQFSLIRKISGTIVYGAIRDVQFAREAKYPLFASSIYMRSGKNRVYKFAQQCELLIEGVKIRPEDIIVGDDNGVIVIPKENLENVIEKAKNIKITEENIVNAIKSGSKLEEARKRYRYDQPWLSAQEKSN
jgi:regulator of RNase E activity RraA